MLHYFHLNPQKKSEPEPEADDDDVMVSFTELQFDPEEDNIPNEMIMSGRQFNILNSKMNLILQFLADTGSKHSISGVEVDSLLKDQESRL